MAVYKLSGTSVKNGRTEYSSFLAGNSAYTLPTSYESIATVTSSSNFTSAEFTSIPSTYTHLQIRCFGRNANNSNSSLIEFNSDTSTTNYYEHAFFGSGAGVSGWYNNNNNLMYWTETGSPANVFGAFIIDILDYTNTNKYKTVKVNGGYDANGTGYSWHNSLYWSNSSAITNIKISAVGSGDFYANSSFALYGIKGA